MALAISLRLCHSSLAGLEAYHQTSIIDLGGLHMGFMRKENRVLIQKTMKLMRICYPETVHSIILINSPAIFPLIWRIVRPWLDPATATKIQVRDRDRDLDRSYPRSSPRSYPTSYLTDRSYPMIATSPTSSHPNHD